MVFASQRSRRLVALLVLALPFVALTAPPASAAQLDPSTAAIGPVRYSATSGVQDSVYGATFMVVGSAFSASPITSDDTVTMRLINAPASNASLWLKRSSGVFPAAGGAADDTLSLAHTSITPTTVGSGTMFNVHHSGALDDTVLNTFIAVSAPGTYSGEIKIYDGATASLVQTTTYSFTTAGRPTTAAFSRTSIQLYASTSDTEITKVTVSDANGKLTQIATSDSLSLASANTAVATANPATLTAQSFDDTLAEPLGSATFATVGSTTAGSTSVTLTPLGTLPAGGMQAVSVPVTAIALASTPPSPFSITTPTTQVVFDDSSTDDTYSWTVNDAFVTHFAASASGATPNTGVVANVTASNTAWNTLVVTGGSGLPAYTVAPGATVPVLLKSDASGNVNLVAAWNSVPDGSSLTITTGSGASARKTVVHVEDPTALPTSTPSGHIIGQTGQAIYFDVTLTDNFGNPYMGYVVAGRATATLGSPRGELSDYATTDSTGQATISVPAPDDTFAGTALVTFVVATQGYIPQNQLRPAEVQVTYTASGQPTSLTVGQAQSTPSAILPTSTVTAYPHIAVPFLGTAATSNGAPGTFNSVTGTGLPNGTMATFTPVSDPPAQIEVTAPEGVQLTTSNSAPWNSGEQGVYVESGSPVYAFSTKTGTFDLSFTVGTLRATGKLKVSTVPAAAYNVTVEPKTQDLMTGAFGTLNVFVTDPFGNPVPATTDDTGGVTVTASGQALLTGYRTSANVTTDDSGQGLVTVIAGKTAGAANFTVTPRAGTRTPAWQPSFTVPSGFSAPVVDDSATVTVTAPPAPPAPATITIVGTRGTVKGKPGFIVDGASTDLPDGMTLTPYLKLAGQTSYAAGSAVITPDSDGTFEWQRKTGKKAYVYIKTADGMTKSNTVVIPGA